MTTTTWRLTPLGWFVLPLAIGAEAISNAIRGYDLGAHLDHLTVHYGDYALSTAGGVMVMAALVISLTQARAAWVALTPARPTRQRLVAGSLAILLLAVSMAAMSSHILDALRAKMGDETGAAGTYARDVASYNNATAELDRLKGSRTTTEVRAAMDRVRIRPSIWAATRECTDAELLKGKINGAACKPILDLREEMAASIRKATLEAQVEDLRSKLEGQKAPRAQASAIEQAVAWYLAWLIGVSVVLVATFGGVVFAETKTIQVSAPSRQPAPEIEIAKDTVPLSIGGTSREEALADLAALVKAGHHPESQDWLAARWGISKGEVSKRLRHWEATGQLPGNRLTDGRRKMVVSA